MEMLLKNVTLCGYSLQTNPAQNWCGLILVF